MKERRDTGDGHALVRGGLGQEGLALVQGAALYVGQGQNIGRGLNIDHVHAHGLRGTLVLCYSSSFMSSYGGIAMCYGIKSNKLLILYTSFSLETLNTKVFC